MTSTPAPGERLRRTRPTSATLLRWTAAGLVAVLLAAAGYVGGAWSRSGTAAPDEASVDVGFLRDMMVHHSQAVTISMIVLPRATTGTVRDLAHETAIDQQREIGVMAGWLQQWGLAESTTAPPMGWMRHAPGTAAGADPPMPGMATRGQVARLAVTRGRAADTLFCRLMLPHHLGALHMIDEEVQRGSRPEVVALALRMRAQQQREVTQLGRMLAALEPAA